MENSTQNKIQLIVTVSAIILLALTYIPKKSSDINPSSLEKTNFSAFSDEIILPISWGDLGKKMIEAGVIDRDKFESLYTARGGFDEETKKLLTEGNNNDLKMTSQNSGTILNLLWAFGLSNQNEILERGPMSDPKYGSPAGFASTGGWTLAKGDVMGHYSKHLFVVLTPEQQVLVEKVSKNIYRPCCNNSTYFPDCNHGMAMLGLLELLASQEISEDEMYKIALDVNSLWFPSQYEAIARFMGAKGIKWQDVNPKEILGINFSSASGYAKVESSLPREQNQGGGSCGV
ncbi:MAG: hypothetical protein Q8P06_02465 [Candidatus Azambacteria bacterium]|nr:hypothetical protein [Candidatus Azambacteria bacterium]